MISGLAIANQSGEHLASRFYRSEASRSTLDAFLSRVISSKTTGSTPPVISMENASFAFTRHKNLYFIAVTRLNSNITLIFEYLFQFIRILKSYLGDQFDQSDIQNNITLIFELFDETMDFGYPQTMAIDFLRMVVNLGEASEEEEKRDAAHLTSQITGVVDWRQEGIRHRKNEVYIDVLENVNLLMSNTGTILSSSVSGKVMMRTQLSGMPECKFGLNDKLIMDRDSSSAGSTTRTGKKIAGVEIDDCSFHRCVRLGQFDAERTITFVPPDGEFQLMEYRVSDNITLPFRVNTAVQEEGRSRLSITVRVAATFSAKTFATNVVVRIPTPPNTGICHIHTGKGSAKHNPEEKAIVWRIRKFTGNLEFTLSAELDLVSTTHDRAWSRPPISLEFQVPMFAASGIHVRFLKVYDKSGYQTQRWVRYITRAGEYQIRF
jgi:AP-2 complex subunit mu-1